MNYPIGDAIIRIKNGYLAKRDSIAIPYSRIREAIVKKLVQLGYLADYQYDKQLKQLRVELKYVDKIPAFTDIKIFSTPGCRYYVSYARLRPVLSGFGHSILSTPKGIVTNSEARKMKVGGELLFNIW